MNVYGAILAKTLKTPNSVTSEQCRVSSPQFPRSMHGTPGTMTPLLARKTVAFSDLGFPRPSNKSIMYKSRASTAFCENKANKI